MESNKKMKNCFDLNWNLELEGLISIIVFTALPIQCFFLFLLSVVVNRTRIH